MKVEQAWDNVVSVIKEFRGLTLDEAAILRESLGIIQKELFPPDTISPKKTEKKKTKKDSK